MSPTFPEPRSAYVHVPFCAHRCGYCDFPLVARRDDLIDDYLRALEIELQNLQQPRTLDTLFLGGGTPTHLAPGQLGRLTELLQQWFSLADGYEFSVEANPAGLTDEKIDILGKAGVNRFSLGVQSFDAAMLELLERDHREAEVADTVDRVRRRCDNISLDLIFGVPGQTVEHWKRTLHKAVRLEPQHISTYGLTFEKGTDFWTRRMKGELVPVPEDREREMYARALDLLPAAGFEQYEISNFARPGFRCRHNEVYWSGQPWFAFGPGAARYVDGRRETNHRSVTTWLKRVLNGESPVAESERLSAEQRAREAAAFALRRTDGIDVRQFREQTGLDIDGFAGEAIEHHVRGGLLERTDSRLRLTREGRFLADSVVVDFL